MILAMFFVNRSLTVCLALLNLHRPYLAQVLNTTPHDLLKHRYSPSVIAIYRASWRLIEGLIATHKRCPLIIERVSLPWSQALSAAVSNSRSPLWGTGLTYFQIVMCLLVTRAPTSSLASASLHELDRLCEFFEKLQHASLTARNNLVRCAFTICYRITDTTTHVGGCPENAKSGTRRDQ